MRDDSCSASTRGMLWVWRAKAPKASATAPSLVTGTFVAESSTAGRHDLLSIKPPLIRPRTRLFAALASNRSRMATTRCKRSSGIGWMWFRYRILKMPIVCVSCQIRDPIHAGSRLPRDLRRQPPGPRRGKWRLPRHSA